MATRRERYLNWNMILYPESAPENWREIIDETRIEWVESPLHDKDFNPKAENEVKKAHYHITLLFPSLKTFDQVSELVCNELNQPIPVKCQSVKGSIRYMVHKDNPEKYQYNWNDIICHGGADLNSLCAPTHTERLIILKEIISFISDNCITELSDFLDICINSGNDEWLSIACHYNTLVISNHIKSIRHKKEKCLK